MMAMKGKFVRLPEELIEKIEAVGRQNKWDFSKQVRATLERDYGQPAFTPIIPSGPDQAHHFKTPIHGTPGRRRRKAA